MHCFRFQSDGRSPLPDKQYWPWFVAIAENQETLDTGKSQVLGLSSLLPIAINDMQRLPLSYQKFRIPFAFEFSKGSPE